MAAFKTFNSFFLLASVAMALSGTCRAECAPEAKTAASRFMNDYVKHANDKKTKVTTLQWIWRNGGTTKSFKKAYQDMVDAAMKEDPELGLDFDPVLDAQDYPDKGFVVESCDASNFVIVRGVDWDTFKVAVKMVKTASGWRVDGAGVINIPEEKKVPRS